MMNGVFLLWFVPYYSNRICKYTIINSNIRNFNIKKVLFVAFLLTNMHFSRKFKPKKRLFIHILSLHILFNGSCL